ncbi:peptide chain release factor N(5)-glutamine methyltransferase [Atopobacter phocae]|uniref:peptide chain release factor N(5)-glutamine methyltransferase n=1 Tax=Atopobacter phocae TaxID=136492 RepID=UPI00046EFFAF|nr:peptide chain release factor N(5)-glutamine methyltransferase [Atopobacter phocae]
MAKTVQPTYRQGEQYVREQLDPQVVTDDPTALYRYQLFLTHQWSLTDYVQHVDEEMPATEWEQLKKLVRRLNAYEPLQYIVERAYFYDRFWHVDQRVLIPRPETEGLVDQARQFIERAPDKALRMADIGTGSGIIGLTLKRLYPTLDVVLTDVSSDALAVAQMNATDHQLEVTMRQGSLLEALSVDEVQALDIIVSNPPYIAFSEQTVMDESVKRYEPQLALYAQQEGLALYETLFRQVKAAHVTPTILLECGYRQGTAIQQLAHGHLPNWDVTIVPDEQGHDRIIIIEPKQSVADEQ